MGGYSSSFNQLANLSRAVFGSGGPTSALRDLGTLSRSVRGINSSIGHATNGLSRGSIAGITSSVRQVQNVLNHAGRVTKIVTPDDDMFPDRHDRGHRQQQHHRDIRQQYPQDDAYSNRQYPDDRERHQQQYGRHDYPQQQGHQDRRFARTEPPHYTPPETHRHPVATQTQPDDLRHSHAPVRHTPHPDALNAHDAMTLQAGMRLMNIDAGPIDGDPGRQTQTGIDAYLKRHPDLHISPDDHQAVLAALRKDMKDNPDIQAKMAHIVETGESANPQDAKAVQALLNDSDKAGLSVDGEIGELTKVAFDKHMSESYDASYADNAAPQETEKPSQPNSQAAQPVDNPNPAVRNTGFGTLTA